MVVCVTAVLFLNRGRVATLFCQPESGVEVADMRSSITAAPVSSALLAFSPIRVHPREFGKLSFEMEICALVEHG